MPDYRGNSNKIYQTLKSDGVTGIGKDENEFYELMQKPDNRKKVYDYLSSNEYTGLGNNLDEFSSFVYNPATNRAERVANTQDSWEQTVDKFSAGVKGAPKALTPFGQSEWKKSPLQPDRIQKEALTPKKSKADRIIEQRNQTQPSPYKPLGTTYEMAKESMPEQKQMDEMFEQTMSDANKRFNKVYGREMQYVPSFSTNSFLGSHLNAVRQANKEVTPSKIIGAIQEKIMGAPQNTEGGNANNAPADPITQEVNTKQAALIYDYVRKKLIERNIPKSKWETFYRTMLSNNLLVNALKAATETPEQLQYDAMAMSDERNPNKLGGIGKVTANVLGVASDPTTYISGGVGSLATKGAMKLGMNTAAKFGTQQASRIMAMGATRMMPRLIGGAANFATFEGLGTFSGQIGSGQDVNLGEIGLSTLKGAGMGALMPLASSWMGRGVDRALGKYANTMGGKVGKYASDFTARTAVFAGGNVVQQWATNPNFDWRTADYGEIIADAAATNLGFDLLHLSKWATGKGEHETLAEANARKKAQIKNFFSNNPTPENGFALTMDDVRTAQKCGLDVKDIKGLVNELGNIAERDSKNGSKYNTDDTASKLTGAKDSDMAKFLQSESMTQSLRDKIETAITGRPSYSRVITHVTMRQDEDGKYHVTTSNNLGVVEDRQFSNKREAEKWMYPQQELVRNGSVMELENLLHAKEFGKVLEDSGDIMAEDFNITPEELKAIINKKENELAPDEKIIVDEYNRRLGNRQLQSVARVRKAIADKYGISEEEMDRIADSDYNKLNSRDKNTFRAYQQELERLNKPVEEVRRDIEKQKSDAIVEQEIDKTVQQIAQEEANSQLITDIIDANGEADTLIKLSTGEGVSLNQSYRDGKKMETSAVKQTLETIGKRLDPAVRQNIDEAFANGSLYDLLIQMDGKMDDDVISYIAAKNSQQGLTDGRVERAVAEATEGIMAQYGRTDGYVSKGIIDGKEVIITSEQGDEFCYYKNPETGEIERCDWDKLQDVPEVVDVENELVTARNMAAEGARASVEHEFAHEPETHADYKAGDNFYALNDKGEVKHQQVVGVDANGNVTYGELGDDGQPKDMKVATKEGLKQMEDEAYRVRNGIKEETETPQENVTEGTATAEGASAEVMSEGEQTATEETEPQKPVSAYESIPKDNKGRTQWSQVSPDVAAKAMLEQHEGDEADALDTINLCIESAKASVEKAENAKIKASDDPDDFIAQKAKNRKAVEEAKKNLDFWKKVRFELQTDIPEEAEIDNTANDVLAQKKAQASNKAKVDSIGLDEANSVYDYILGWIASGAKFKWGDDSGSQGLKNETGYSRSDIPTFYLDNKNGQTPDQMAHAIWEAMPERLKSQTDDMEIKDHILDIMQSHKNYTEMADEFVRRHTVDESQFEGQRPTDEGANKPVDFTDVTTKDENGDDYPFSKSEETSKTVEDAEPAKVTMTVKERLSQQRAAEEMQKQAVNAAVSEGKRLGTDIHVVNTPEELKNVLGEGYADMDADEVNAFTMPDGEIYIYAPSMTDSRFAIRQVWHEVVAHKGVKALLPAEDRKLFFKNVYDTMTDYAKDRFSRYVFDTLGAKSRKELGYDSYEELVQDKQAFETFIAKHSQKIADEYVARVYAENGDFERGVFQRMVDWLTHWAHEKFGGKLGIDKFSDADIRYILGESQEKLAKGGVRNDNGETNEQATFSKNEELAEFTYTKEDEERFKDIHPVKKGLFGNVFNQFKGNVKDAVKYLLHNREGVAVAALHHDKVGDIDLWYGNEKAGLEKIAIKHPNVLPELQRIIEKLPIKTSSDNRIILEDDTHRAVISKMLGNKKTDNWLLSAYEKTKSASSSDIETEPNNGMQNGTAALHFDSSHDKGTSSLSNPQGVFVKSNGSNAFFVENDADLQSEDNTRFSKKEKKEDEKKSLMGVHNLTEDKLRKVLKQGGLANPSLAVIDTDNHIHTNYGEISLIPKSSLIDSKTGKNAGTFTADAWTPTYPQVTRRMNNKGRMQYYKDMRVLDDEPQSIRSKMNTRFDSWMEQGNHPEDLSFWYLKEKGIEPEKVYYESDVPAEDKEAFKRIMDGKDRFGQLSQEEKKQMYDLIAKDRETTAEELLDKYEAIKEDRKKDLESEERPHFKKLTEDFIAEVETYGLPYRMISDYIYKMEQVVKKDGTVNSDATILTAAKQVKEQGMEPDFKRWLDDKAESYGIEEWLFDGFDNNGNKKWKRNTLQNASRMMKKQGLNGATGLTSIGTMIAAVANRLKSTKDIRKYKKNLNTTLEEHEEFKKKWGDILFDLSEKCGTGLNDWAGEERLREALGEKNPAEHLKKEYGVDLSSEDRQLLDTFIHEVRENFPTGYFETKFERPVTLDEFAVAVIPEGTSDDVIAGLKSAGLDVRTYNKESEESRKKAVMDAVNSRNDILFSRKEREELDRKGEESVRFAIDEYKKRMKVFHGSGADFDHFDIKFLGTGEGAQAYGHGHYVTEVKGIGEKYAMIAKRKPLGARPVLYKGKSLENAVQEDWSEEKREIFFDLAERQTRMGESASVAKEKLQTEYDIAIKQNERGAESFKSREDKWKKAVEYLEGITDEQFRELINSKKWEDFGDELAYLKSVINENSDLGRGGVLLVCEEGIDNCKRYQRLHINRKKFAEAKKKALEEFDENDFSRGNYASVLYTVDIPDDNGSNYLKWDEPLTETQVKMFVEQAAKEGKDDYSLAYRDDEGNLKPNAGTNTGEWFYRNELSRVLGSDKEASNFLTRAGFVGIKYPAEYRSGGREDNAHNYVIFDDTNLAITDKVRFSKKETDDKERPHLYGGLYSNAEKAVLDIKQNKATADQWLNMLKNNGGLKEGEDKWIGLSDWLKVRRGMTTKDEVLDFIRKNAVDIEEVNYTESEDAPKEVQDKFDKYMNELGDEQEAWDRLVDEYGDDFEDAFWLDEGKVLVNDADAARELVDLPARPIDDTRLLYTTKGLKNKREVALTVPTIEAYNENDETHFGDAGEGRAVAWCRFGETADADGNRVLVVDEVQSNRHQQGRENGYRGKNFEKKLSEMKEAEKASKSFIREMVGKYLNGVALYPEQWTEYATEEEKLKGQKLFDEYVSKMKEADYTNWLKKIPDAPFDKNWHELVMKRMLRYAAENDYDKVAWTSGEQQAERYNIGNVVNTIEVSPYEAQSHNEVDGFDVDIHVNDADTKTLFVSKDGVISGGEFAGMKLADVLGKELANDILSTTEYREIDGKDLRIGGEGMKGFYDKILPNFMNKFGKKFGAKVGVVTLPDVEEAGREMWSVDVTPEMKRTAMEEGFPMFSKKEREEHIEKANKKFNEEIDKFTIPDADKFNFKLGRPSETLIAAGVADKPILLYGNKLAKKIGKHGFKAEDLKDLPKKMENPIAVFNNYGNDDNRSILTELTTSQGNVLVAVNVGKNNYADFNIVASAFGKGQDKIIDWFKRGYATYIDKKKALNYLYSSAPIAATPNNKELYDAANVVKSFDEAKFWNDYNTSQTKNNASVSANNNNLQSAVDNSGVNFSADENEPFERDAAGRPIQPRFDKMSDYLTKEGTKKLDAWAKAASKWDAEHPMDVKNRIAAASHVERLIKSALDEANVDEVTKGQLMSAMKNIKNTKTISLVENTSKGFKIAAGAISKAYEKQIHDMMTLKVRDKNGRGNAIGKKIDAITAQTFEYLRGFYDTNKKKFTVDSAVLDAKIQELEDKIGNRVDDAALTDDEAMRQNAELAACNILKRVSESNVIGSKLQELIDKQTELQSKIDELNARMKDAQDTYIGDDGKEHSFAFDIAQLEMKAEKEHINLDSEIADLKARRSANMKYNYKADDGTTHVFRDDIEELKEAMEANDLDINTQMRARLDAQDVIRTKLADLIDDGREYRRDKAEDERKRRQYIVHSVLEAIDNPSKPITQEDVDSQKYERGNFVSRMWDASMASFEYMCKNYATNGFGGENFLYDYFIRGKNGVIEASNEYEFSMRKHTEALDAKCKEIYGKRFLEVVEDNAKEVKNSGVTIKVDVDARGENRLGEQGGRSEVSLSKGQATYLYMLWRMSDGKAQLMRQGYDENSMEQIADFIGKENQAFADFMQMEYLPALREKYNNKYIEVFDTSMAHVDNYVPLRRSKMKILGKDDFTATGNGNPQTITKGASALIERTHNTNNIDSKADAFKVLFDHLNEMEEWNAYARVRQDLQYVFNSPAIRHRLNRNNKGAFQMFADAAKAAVLIRDNTEASLADEFWSEMAKSFTTNAIAFRLNTAAKQTTSLPAFLDYSLDPRYWGLLAKNWGIEQQDIAGFALGAINAPLHLFSGGKLGVKPTDLFAKRAQSDKKFVAGLSKNFAWCMNNIPNFYERVMNQTTADPIMNDKARAERVADSWTDALLYNISKFRTSYGEHGFAANKIVDAATCAIGAKSIYDYKYAREMEKVKRNYKEGTTEYENAEKEAHRLAIAEATIAFNSSQQSSHAAFLSPLQRSRSLSAKALTLFKNSPMSYSRKLSTYLQDMAKAGENLKSGKMTDYYTKRIMLESPNITEEEARRAANKHIAIGAVKAMWGTSLYGLIIPWIWATAGKACLGFFGEGGFFDWDDDDEKHLTQKEIEAKKINYWNEKASYIFDGVPVVQMAIDIPLMVAGYKKDWSINSGNPGLQMCKDLIDEVADTNEEFGFFSPQMVGLTASRAAQMATGFNIDTWMNMGVGTAMLCRDGYITANDIIDDGKSDMFRQCLIDHMYIMNSPTSQRKQMAKEYYAKKYKDMPYEQYENAMKIASDYYGALQSYASWLPNSHSMSEKKAKEMYDEFMRYRSDDNGYQQREANKEVVKENNSAAPSTSNAKKMEEYAKNTGRHDDYQKYLNAASEFSKYSSAFNTLQKLRKQGDDKKANAFEKEHKGEIERYEDNVGKFKTIDAMMKRFGMDGENDEETFNEIIKELSE